MDNIKRKYGYSYDHQHRLTAAYYQLPGTVIPRSDSYSTSYSYDENGNILSLKRNGKEDDPNLLMEIDDLDYTYDQGNRLLKVNDATDIPAGFDMNGAHTNDQYDYDDYGNLRVDPYKKISHISYNHLNLPVKITFTGGETVEYTYLADGTKIEKTATDSENNTTTTEYRDGFQYKNNILEFFPHAEGYVKSTESVNGYIFNYVFTHTDHLGNIRIKYTQHPQTGEIRILEEDHYYPYGLTHEGYSGNHQIFGFDDQTFTLIDVMADETDTYKYKFNGFEYQTELGLNWYDYGSRNYQPDLGRWMNIDPMAEKYHNFSPYHTSANNPVVFMDYNGEDYIVTVNLENQTATVSGTLYATGEDMAAAQTGANFWNDQSGDFSYTYKDGDGNSHSLTVNFDINVQEVTIGEGETKMGALNKALGEDNTGGGNVFVVVPDDKLGDNVNGTTQTNFIQVKESMVNADTPAHEVGHALGVPHSNSGVMTAAQSSTNRTPTINTTNVKRSVKDAIRGRESNDGRGRSTLNFPGNVNLPNTAKDQRRFKNGKVKKNE